MHLATANIVKSHLTTTSSSSLTSPLSSASSSSSRSRIPILDPSTGAEVVISREPSSITSSTPTPATTTTTTTTTVTANLSGSVSVVSADRSVLSAATNNTTATTNKKSSLLSSKGQNPSAAPYQSKHAAAALASSGLPRPPPAPLVPNRASPFAGEDQGEDSQFASANGLSDSNENSGVQTFSQHYPIDFAHAPPFMMPPPGPGGVFPPPAHMMMHPFMPPHHHHHHHHLPPPPLPPPHSHAVFAAPPGFPGMDPSHHHHHHPMPFSHEMGFPPPPSSASMDAVVVTSDGSHPMAQPPHHPPVVLSPNEQTLKRFVIHTLESPDTNQFQGSLSAEHVESLAKFAHPNEFREVVGNSERRQGLWLAFLKRIQGDEVVVYPRPTKGGSAAQKVWYLRSSKHPDWAKADKRRDEVASRNERENLQILIDYLLKQPGYEFVLDSICSPDSPVQRASGNPAGPSEEASAPKKSNPRPDRPRNDRRGGGPTPVKFISLFTNQKMRPGDFVRWTRQQKQLLLAKSTTGEWKVSLNPTYATVMIAQSQAREAQRAAAAAATASAPPPLPIELIAPQNLALAEDETAAVVGNTTPEQADAFPKTVSPLLPPLALPTSFPNALNKASASDSGVPAPTSSTAPSSRTTDLEQPQPPDVSSEGSTITATTQDPVETTTVPASEEPSVTDALRTTLAALTTTPATESTAALATTLETSLSHVNEAERIVSALSGAEEQARVQRRLRLQIDAELRREEAEASIARRRRNELLLRLSEAEADTQAKEAVCHTLSAKKGQWDSEIATAERNVDANRHAFLTCAQNFLSSSLANLPGAAVVPSTNVGGPDLAPITTANVPSATGVNGNEPRAVGSSMGASLGGDIWKGNKAGGDASLDSESRLVWYNVNKDNATIDDPAVVATSDEVQYSNLDDDGQFDDNIWIVEVLGDVDEDECDDDVPDDFGDDSQLTPSITAPASTTSSELADAASAKP